MAVAGSGRRCFALRYAAMGAEKDARAARMQSPVNWALLGLVIDRPSYAYELARRFERTYDGVLTLSSVSHVYTALATLKERALVEEIPGTRSGGRPKTRYRATHGGLIEYGDWLVDEVREDRRRQRLFVLQMGSFVRDPGAAIGMLDRYEQACLQEVARIPLVPEQDRSSLHAGHAVLARLSAEEARLALDAKLRWLQYARSELRALAEAQKPAR
jgi:DNA-binding PadR family transcriptional regulator